MLVHLACYLQWHLPAVSKTTVSGSSIMVNCQPRLYEFDLVPGENSFTVYLPADDLGSQYWEVYACPWLADHFTRRRRHTELQRYVTDALRSWCGSDQWPSRLHLSVLLSCELAGMMHKGSVLQTLRGSGLRQIIIFTLSAHHLCI